MTDLRRWKEEGASEGEATLLESSRAERLPSASRKRILAGIGLALPTSAVAQAGLGVALATKVVVGAVVLSAAVGGAVWTHRAKPVAVRPPVRVESVVAPSPAPEPVATPAEETVVEKSAEPAPAHALFRKKVAAHPPLKEATLAQEVRHLEKAQEALQATRTTEALAILDRCRAQFPTGALASEERVLRIRTLLAAGKVKEARTVADAFLKGEPDSPYAKRVRAVVDGMK